MITKEEERDATKDTLHWISHAGVIIGAYRDLDRRGMIQKKRSYYQYGGEEDSQKANALAERHIRDDHGNDFRILPEYTTWERGIRQGQTSSLPLRSAAAEYYPLGINAGIASRTLSFSNAGK
jgi:hypothetical protein